MQFNSEDMEDLIDTIKKSLDKIGDGYDLKLDMGRLTYYPDTKTLKFNVEGAAIMSFAGISVPADLIMGMKLHGVNVIESHLGKLTGYTKGKKMPFHYTDVHGQKKVASVQFIQSNFRDMDKAFI
jgi:hypothetical protein